jgi:hypothetical protein
MATKKHGLRHSELNNYGVSRIEIPKSSVRKRILYYAAFKKSPFTLDDYLDFRLAPRVGTVWASRCSSEPEADTMRRAVRYMVKNGLFSSSDGVSFTITEKGMDTVFNIGKRDAQNNPIDW